MGRKSILERYGVVTGSQMTASWTSNPMDTSTFDGGCVVFAWSASTSVSGALQPYGGQDINVVQGTTNTGNIGGSDLPQSKKIAWFPWTVGFTPSVPLLVSGTSGVIPVAFQYFPYKWMQWQYSMVTAATGSMTGSMYGKNVGA